MKELNKKQIAALVKVLNSQQKQLISQQEQIKSLTADFVKQGELIASIMESKKEKEE